MFNNKIYLVCTIFILFFLPVFAQNHAIKGRIYNEQNHEIIANAFIQLVHDKNVHTTSDMKGEFILKTTKIKGLIKVFCNGYITRNIYFDLKDDSLPFNIILTPDTHIFTSVLISAFGNTKSIKETSGSVAYLSAKQMNSGNGTSIQQALNRVPGVRMDQSNLGDSRISIRGNGVRSPWGMRNIKVYINGIPLTETDGTTRIEALDVPALGSAEIIKGPASSIYGAGIGGVIKFQLAKAPYQEQSIELSGVVGSYGLNREQITYRGGGNKMNSYVSYGHQYYGGYRTHANDKRDFLTANFQFFPTEKQDITLLISRTSQKTQIPGALTQSQVETNPKQAALANLKTDAGRMQNWTRIGIGQKYTVNKYFKNQTSIFVYMYDLHHPLPFGIIRNFYQSYGGRTLFEINPHFKLLPTVFTIGGEFNQALTKGAIYANDSGIEGSLFSNTNYKNTAYTAFLQLNTKFWKIIDLEVGISYNGLQYKVSDFLHTKRSGIKDFKAQASPRISISHNFGNWMSLHGSVSYGFSNPTTSEIQNADQSLNMSIQAVKGINYEIDAKGNLLHSRLNYSLSVYAMKLKGELIAQNIMPGITVYQNSGKTDHKGIELGLSYTILKHDDNKFIQLLNPYLSISYSDFIVTDYNVIDKYSKIVANYDGNKLVGVAPWTISAGVDLETKFGFFANINYYFSDKYALNDANTDYNPEYNILNGKIGYNILLWKRFQIKVFGGIKNILNEKYSSFTALNASIEYGPAAYFNPSPERNFYAGLSLKYLFNNHKK